MRASVDYGSRLRDLKMIGPPGSGKTMLAKRLPTILKNWDVASLLNFSGLSSPTNLGGGHQFRIIGAHLAGHAFEYRVGRYMSTLKQRPLSPLERVGGQLLSMVKNN